MSQLHRVAGLPGCVRAVGMPDLHPGPGIPIGMVAASVSHVHPSLVGSDAGCGVTVAVARRLVPVGKRLRRIDRATAEPAGFEIDPLAALRAAWHGGPRGLAELPECPEEFRAWVRSVPWGETHGPSAELPDELREPRFGEALGTIGGGNHFVELARVDRVLEDEALAGLHRGAFVVLAHSGSRGLGYALIQRWCERSLHEPDEVARYLGELAGCCRFAQANRALLVWRMLEAVGSGRADRVGGTLDLVHNDVSRGSDPAAAWVHRKGAAPARAGELTVTLGSRGAPSWILRGRGDEAHLCSVAHGAGRQIPRAEAKGRLAHRYRRAELGRSKGGGHVLCDRSELLWEEHPDVYKPIEPVVAALEGAGIATRVAALVPEVTVKR
ncbi:MAG: RtcB family protein [Myxococcales bacterium]|nr:RtcB family protein [Myxococcales bacterium]MCB9716966.1 RtcB family protein [Myxococcales bacterium]